MRKNNLLKLCCTLALVCIFAAVEGVHASTIRTESEQQSQRTIKGKVVDEDGEPLIGATVRVKNVATGTITDSKGLFNLQTPQTGMIEVSYVGYKPLEVALSSQQFYTIVLESQIILMDDVVVTALGIKRERKALGYAVGEIKGEELNTAKEMNVINSLAGKIAGVVVTQGAGGPAGASKIVIRGNTSLTGSNNPLYVVDGVPLDNTSFGSAGQYGGYDLGDGISSINPDDIESMSVLKGPAASALYGSRAAHGVILITTKKAKASAHKSLGIEVNSNITFEKQSTQYDNIQRTYGQGWSGTLQLDDTDSKSSSSSWGPKFDAGIILASFDGVPRPFVYIDNNVDGFFNTGVTATNSLILNSVKEDNSIRIAYTNLTNKDIMPNATIQRNSIDVRDIFKIGKKLEVDLKVNYVNEVVENRPALSDSRTNVANNLMNLASNIDQAWLRDNYQNADGTYFDWNSGDTWNINPYWIQYAMKNETKKHQYMGIASLKYDIMQGLHAKLTGGGENVNFKFMDYIPYSTPSELLGKMQQSIFENSSYNLELLVNYQTRVKDFGFNITGGGNIYHVDNRSTTIVAKNMEMKETVALQSFLEKETTQGGYRKQINSAFLFANISWKDFLYTDLTMRADKSSTLPSDNNVYYYPSISGSFLFSELLPNKKIINYGKIRASWAQVGSDTDPYMLELNYKMTDKTFDKYPTGYISSSVIPNKDLKPTKTNSFETGLELRMFNDRLGFEFTYYTQDSKNQIMYVPTSVTSSYPSQLINAGNLRNSGIEITLNTRPIQNKDYSWDLNFNFSKNNNKVIELNEGIESLEIAAARWLGVKVLALPGEEYGVIMGQDFKRNENGDIIINAQSGLPEITDDLQKLGKATWDWTGGLSTSFRYKNIKLSAIIDVKVGADMFTMTDRSLVKSGKSMKTIEGRDAWDRSEEERISAGILAGNWAPTGGYVAPGVIEETDANGNKTYRTNDIIVNPRDYWEHVTNKTAAPFMYDNSYVKMRELTVGYVFPKKWINKYLESLSVSFVARNPFTIYKNIPNIDPDSNYNTSAIGLEYGSLPTRRSFGVNVNVKF